MNGEVVAVLLAGGLSRRMGGHDKMLRDLGGESILARVVARIKSQADRLLLNANGDAARFADFSLPVAADVIEGHPGPLAGVLTGMEWARVNAPDCPWVVTAPTDAPFLPCDLVQRLVAAVEAEGADMACASSGGRHHPVCGLWPVRLAGELRRAMLEEDIRKVDIWTARYRLAVADWPTDPIDPFFNANRPEDLAEAERILGDAE
jgi:molybdopterin-guanine dinucleotide biosynthesis protein A